MRVVVAGYGMAGARLVSELRSRAEDLKVTAFSGEKHQPYNRILLSSLLAGKVTEDDLALAGPPTGADVRLDTPILRVDPRRRVVVTAEEEIEYDALVLATGAQPVRPPIAGLDRPGVHVLRTLDDCRAIVSSCAAPSPAASSWVAPSRAGLTARSAAGHAVVLGGGLLGLEAARGLAGRGLDVTIVHSGQHVLERQLEAGGAEVLARTLAGLGLRVRTGARATAFAEDGLHLSDGTVVPADLLVIACGVRPDTTLARTAGLAVGRGILVDSGLRTSDPAIWAIGDCAEHDGVVHGLVAPAWDQAATVADRLTGGSAAYRGSRLVTRLKANGVDLATMGTVEAGADDEVVTFADPARGTYARLVIRDNRLTGAIMLGDNPSVGTVTQLYDRNAEVPTDRRSLLLGRAFGAPTPVDTPAFMPDQAIVCRCNSVSKAAIVASWRAGARGHADVARATRATTGCGSCRDAVTGITDWLSSVAGGDQHDTVAGGDQRDTVAGGDQHNTVAGGDQRSTVDSPEEGVVA